MLLLMVMITRNPDDGDDDDGFICIYIYRLKIGRITTNMLDGGMCRQNYLDNIGYTVAMVSCESSISTPPEKAGCLPSAILT